MVRGPSCGEFSYKNSSPLLLREFLQSRTIDLGHVEIAIGIEAEHVRHFELAGLLAFLSPALLDVARRVEPHDTVRQAIGQEQLSILVESQTVGSESAPNIEQLSFVIEDLNALVLAVSDQQPTAAVDNDRMGDIELSG